MRLNIQPLRGQCLIEILPPDESISGIIIPDNARLTPKGEKLPPEKGIVRRLGPWPQKKGGLCVLPEFVPGDKVLVSQYSGQKMQREIGEQFRMVRVEDVLAVLK